MKRNFGSILNKTTIIILFIMLGLGLFLSAKWGAAAISHSLAMNHLESWRKHHKIPSHENWQWTYDALLFAEKFDPKNAEYHNDLGRFYEFTADVIHDVGLSKLSLHNKAIGAFRLATTLNPSWAIAWANLALLKHKSGQIDKEFSLSVHQALQLGGSLAPVQVIMGEIGVARWLVLSVELRQKMLDNMHYVLKSKHRFELIKTMKYYQMFPYFCLILEAEDKQKFCSKK